MNRNIIALSLSTALALTACKNGDSGPENQSLPVEATAVGNTDIADTSRSTGVDAAFVTDGIKGDTAEEAIGQLAASKGASQGVRDFGNMLVTDHGAHKQKLIKLAKSANIAIPTEPADSGHAQLEKLQKLNGATFDKALLETLIGNHKKGIAKNEAQVKSGDSQTAKLAQETLPVLNKHLATAEDLAK